MVDHLADGAGSAVFDALALARRPRVATLHRQPVVKLTNVIVGVRSRPLSREEAEDRDEDAWQYDGNTLWETTPMGERLRQYAFNHVFAPPASTTEVYAALGTPIVTSVMEGYHGTVFAYGQTGALLYFFSPVPTVIKTP